MRWMWLIDLFDGSMARLTVYGFGLAQTGCQRPPADDAVYDEARAPTGSIMDHLLTHRPAGGKRLSVFLSIDFRMPISRPLFLTPSRPHSCTAVWLALTQQACRAMQADLEVRASRHSDPVTALPAASARSPPHPSPALLSAVPPDEPIRIHRRLELVGGNSTFCRTAPQMFAYADGIAQIRGVIWLVSPHHIH